MNEKEFLAKMEEIMDLDAGILKMNSLLGDIEEWDSLSVLSLTIFVKKTLEKELTTASILEFKTIQDIYNYCYTEE